MNQQKKEGKGSLSRKVENVLKVIGVAAIIYILLLSPIFFMYPNQKERVKRNIDRDYFDTLSDTLTGDCYRISQNFALECPFPTRAVHLSGDHTIVEIKINNKWYAYDPLYQKFFNFNDAIKISFDVNRGYIAPYLENYHYTYAFKDVKYYHNYYFIFLKFICPFYDDIMRVYYNLGS
jgi:hypothetical protein